MGAIVSEVACRSVRPVGRDGLRTSEGKRRARNSPDDMVDAEGIQTKPWMRDSGPTRPAHLESPAECDRVRVSRSEQDVRDGLLSRR